MCRQDRNHTCRHSVSPDPDIVPTVKVTAMFCFNSLISQIDDSLCTVHIFVIFIWILK